MGTTSAIRFPCSGIQQIIDKMIANTHITPDEFALAVVHMPICQECLDYMSMRLQSQTPSEGDL
jgi:hypothetical protein